MAARDGGGATLLVASTGGHLEQLFRLSRRFLEPGTTVRWATFDGDQSRALLAGQDVTYLSYIAPRDLRAVAANVPLAQKVLRSGNIDRVVSTGSAIALCFLPLARAHGISTHYIESAARAAGPSLTGRIVARVPGVRLYCQYPGWADRKWVYRGSLYDGYSVAERPAPEKARRVVVTLGTMQTYQFPRAVDAVQRTLAEVAAPDAEVLWQVGVTAAPQLGSAALQSVPPPQLHAAMREADLVVAHAGIGSALAALDAGARPVLLVRRKAHGEHVDDHQAMIAGELHRRGLAVSKEPDALVADDLRFAMAGKVLPATQEIPFLLRD